MKNLTAVIAFCAIFLMALSNFTTESVKTFVITTISEAPVLPEETFDYADIVFPKHLLDVDSMNIGYEAGHVDTFTVANINNDAATLGRVLFYDEKLSALENISCASCHQQEKSFADNLALSEGISALTKRNSMALNDLGWTNKSHFFWDMSQVDLHEMIILPLTDENEIGANMDDIELKLSATSYYPDLFEKAYGTSTIDEERIVDALVQFISSMVTFNSKFDQSAQNGFQDFTTSELNGLELFSTKCNSCHSQGSHSSGFIIDGGIFQNEADILEFLPFIFNNGLPEDPNDNGAGSWDNRFNNLFKIPSLRNVAKTGPYMHDGRFESLEEVIDHYSEGIEENEWSLFFPPGEGGFNFSNQEKADLLAFLNTLSDDSFTTEERWSNPFGNSTSNTPEVTDLSFTIKPNPMMSNAYIEFDNAQSGESAQVNILSSSGQLIEKHFIHDQQFKLDKNKFSAGLYFIEISQGDKRSLQKLIVQ